MTVAPNRLRGDDRLVLLVEDDDDEAMLATRALNSNGVMRIRRAVDGADALEKMRELPRPALVLLDIRLPILSGIDVLRHARAEPLLAGIPMVALSSSDEERDVRDVYSSGGNAYVRKPTDFPEFVECVRRLVDFWIAINRLPS